MIVESALRKGLVHFFYTSAEEVMYLYFVLSIFMKASAIFLILLQIYPDCMIVSIVDLHVIEGWATDALIEVFTS